MGNITDPQTGHNPSTGSIAPASWGDDVRNALIEASWGVLGYAEITTNSSSFTTGPTDITGLSVAVTVGTDRIIEVACQGMFSKTTAGNCRLTIREGSTTLTKWVDTLADGYEATMAPIIRLTPSAGSHTYKVSGENSVGSGAIYAGTEYPAWIRVTDLGSAV